MWYLKIWLAVIVVLVCSIYLSTSEKVDTKRHDRSRVPMTRAVCKNRKFCKNGKTPMLLGRWRCKCVCKDGWTGRRCGVPKPKPVCKNRKFCKNGGTPVCPKKSRRPLKCICAEGWTGRRCDELMKNDKQSGENKDFVSVIITDERFQDIPPYIYMTTDTSTNVNITTLETLPEDHITAFNSSVTIPYPEFGINGSSYLKAIRIRSAENISAAVSVHHDITTLITTEKLSTSYVISPPYRSIHYYTYAGITVSAIHDNTSITFSELGEAIISDYTLNALETRVHEYYDQRTKIFSVQSSKPVAVFCGLYCLSDPTCSNMIEQIPPTNQLDTVFIIPTYHDMSMNLALVLSQENTTITDSNNETKSLIAGKRSVLTTPQGTPLVVRSEAPVLLTTYALRGPFTFDQNPYWSVVPGLKQYLPRYKIISRSGWKNFISIMIRKSAVDGLRANKQAIATTSIRVENTVFVEDLEYTVLTVEVEEGELTLESTDDTPFGLMAYGTQGRSAYSFAGNVILR